MANKTDVNSDKTPLQWQIACELAFEVVEPAEVILQVAVSRSSFAVVNETLDVVADGRALTIVEEVPGPYGGRFHELEAPASRLTVRYQAELQAISSSSSGRGQSAGAATTRFDREMFLRPSRYCPSDHLTGFAASEFGAISDVDERALAITNWIYGRIEYVPGSSTVHDSAEDTLLTGRGMCRDFAHLGVALCRASGIPARFVAVYAPGLDPMDFHAVFESFEDGRWVVHDATGLSPRQSFVRIVTGRDAADTAFAAINSGIAKLEKIEVFAVVAPSLPIDDRMRDVELA